MNNKEAMYWISALGLQKHPEGGYFAERYKSPATITMQSGKSRGLASSIYYLLPNGEISRFHRLSSDELWYHHAGDPVTIHLIDPSGTLLELRLGINAEEGEQPQAVIPAGSIFGATSNGGKGYSLVGCMVCPGFDYADFELMDRKELLAAFPQYKEMILKLT